ncbi:hypothetical protein QBC38DRAFT_461971 [Podospora fimiseda]|uniref:Uncharacterized protein n=1 Tax=Podospora fimiseda TaxID=252190 RepID=A0AAN6YLL8_9PEZI|nr:hypothetical protein QBC38DRAFT_461971 [Podospora fimiseda]
MAKVLASLYTGTWGAGYDALDFCVFRPPSPSDREFWARLDLVHLGSQSGLRLLGYCLTWGEYNEVNSSRWHSVADEDEREFYRERLGQFRWGLRVRSKGVGFVGVALKEMEESLREIDMTSRPVPSFGCSAAPEAIGKEVEKVDHSVGGEVFESYGYTSFPGLDQGFHYFHQQSAEMDDPSTFSLGGEFVTLDGAQTFEGSLYGT